MVKQHRVRIVDAVSGEEADHEGMSMVELIRRTVDVFLAWDDPAYVPTPPSKKERPFLSARKRRGFLGGPL